jgi:hypothetical protein
MTKPLLATDIALYVECLVGNIFKRQVAYVCHIWFDLVQGLLRRGFWFGMKVVGGDVEVAFFHFYINNLIGCLIREQFLDLKSGY